MTLMLPLLGVHLASAVVALVQGSRAWWAPRGTVHHRKLGMWFVSAGIPLCATACALNALGGRSSATLFFLAWLCMASGIATPLLARSAWPVLRSWHGLAACFSLACLGGAILEVLVPGAWTWPVVGLLTFSLRAFPRPIPLPARG